MDARDYLTDIKARLVASAVIASIRIVEEYALPDRGYIRVRLELINTDFLEAALRNFPKLKEFRGNRAIWNDQDIAVEGQSFPQSARNSAILSWQHRHRTETTCSIDRRSQRQMW